MKSNKPIVIVSGLPRSGTSMMMRILEAGGMPVLVDNIRKADEDNPRGYYEFEDVKNTREKPSWLDEAQGKAVKMVSMLLYDLPEDRRYKVIFMKRKMEEILASQRKMLERKGQLDTTDYEAMSRSFTKHLLEIEKWLEEQINFQVVYVNYNDILNNPLQALRPVNTFLGESLDLNRMTDVVDESLYRQRKFSTDSGNVQPEEAEDPGEKEKIIDQLKSLGYME